jgi:hypothetical protein
MGLLASTLGEARALVPVVERIVQLNDSAADSAESIADAYAKGARTVAPAPTLYGPGGSVVSGPSRTSGGASGSSRGGGSGSGSGGRGGEAFVIDEFGNVRSLGALPLDATGLPIFDVGERVSGTSAAGGGGGPAATRIRTDNLGNYNTAAYRSAANPVLTAPLTPIGGGKATVYDPTVAGELRGLRSDFRDLTRAVRGDGGAQLVREGII